MELNDYQNFNELSSDPERSCRGKQEELKPEQGGKSAESAQEKQSPLVIYILLGLTILLFVLIFTTAIILFSQMFNEMKRIDGNLEKELAQVMSNASQMFNEMKRIDRNLEMELSQVTSNVTRMSKEMRNAIAELKAKVSKLKEDQRHVQCPPHWMPFQKSCYYFSSVEKDQVDAQRFCTSMNANLVVVNSAEERVFLQHWTQRGNHWIGLNDSISEGDWHWVDGTDYASSVKFWKEGEPNDLYKIEDCVEMLIYGEWNDELCNSSRYWICEKSA